MTRICDLCRASSAAMYCTADMAYMCLSCDVKIHAANKLASRHEKTWICEVCEHAPAAVICKADAAALCSSCDSDIHSANPLASRHERVAVTPFFDCPSMVRVAHVDALSMVHNSGDVIDLVPPELLHFDHQQAQLHVDPIESFVSSGVLGCSSISFDCLQSTSTAPAAAVVPDSSSSMSSDMSNPYVIDYLCQMSPSPQLLHQRQSHHSQEMPHIAREERVMRYREKKKTRKFEKTVRYASRKAYAEIRPRVKGRFVKRTAATDVVEQFIVDSVVPSF